MDGIFKKLKPILGILTSISIVSLPAFGQNEPQPIEIPSTASKMYVPHGFDANDEVEIMLAGIFPNSCYRVGESSAKVNDKNEIRITANEIYMHGSVCLMVIKPFMHVVKVGKLEPGEYTAYLVNKPEVKTTFSIKQNLSDNVDDYLYAPVENATIDISYESGMKYLEISGRFPLFLKGCAFIQDVLINDDQPEVIVVQPIMGIRNGQGCANHRSEFKEVRPLESAFVGEGLLHVRAINGHSLNKLVVVPD